LCFRYKPYISFEEAIVAVKPVNGNAHFLTSRFTILYKRLVNSASDYDNIFDFISQTFSKRSKEVETKNQFEALLVWYAAERIASEVG